jgi:very-short-patch-repair endonuclease
MLVHEFTNHSNCRIPPFAKGGNSANFDRQCQARTFFANRNSVDGLKMIIAYNRKLKDRSRALRTNSTAAEIHLWKRLRGRQINGMQFYRQKIIGNCIVDFYCSQAKLVIELDGGQHFSEAGFRRDAERDHYLQAQGLRVLRFSDSDIFTNTDGVLNSIVTQMSKKDALA